MQRMGWVLLGLLVGCSTVFDFDKQCEGDGDCDGDRCYQGQCITGPIPCASHLDCDQTAELTGTELCVANACQSMIFDNPTGGGCRELFGQLSDDPANTLIIPTLQSLTGEGSAFGPESAVNGYRMAARFANDSRGLSQRRVVMVLCDDASDETAAEDVARTIIERTGATSMLGPTGENGLSAIVDVLVPNRVMHFVANPSMLFSTLIDDNLTFRVYPSDQLSVRGFSALAARYPDARIGLLYRQDILVRRVLGETVRQALLDRLLTTVAYDGTDAESIRSNAATVATFSGDDPLDLVMVLGGEEMPAVVRAYRDALPNGFANARPRIITDAPGALLIAPTIEQVPDLTPFDIEAVVGAAVSASDFAALYEASFGSTDNLQVAGVFYDGAMLTLMAHAAAPDAADGTVLAEALRSRVTVPGATPVDGAQGAVAVGSAAAELASGGAIQYVQVAGGLPTRFDTNGDVDYPIIAGTFTDSAASMFVPLRLLFGDIWLDACFAPDEPCERGWTDAAEDPGQTCFQIDGFELGICAPNCTPMVACPVATMSCMGDAEAGICLPPAP